MAYPSLLLFLFALLVTLAVVNGSDDDCDEYHPLTRVYVLSNFTSTIVKPSGCRRFTMVVTAGGGSGGNPLSPLNAGGGGGSGSTLFITRNTNTLEEVTVATSIEFYGAGYSAGKYRGEMILVTLAPAYMNQLPGVFNVYGGLFADNEPNPASGAGGYIWFRDSDNNWDLVSGGVEQTSHGNGYPGDINNAYWATDQVLMYGGSSGGAGGEYNHVGYNAPNSNSSTGSGMGGQVDRGGGGGAPSQDHFYGPGLASFGGTGASIGISGIALNGVYGGGGGGGNRDVLNEVHYGGLGGSGYIWIQFH